MYNVLLLFLLNKQGFSDSLWRNHEFCVTTGV